MFDFSIGRRLSWNMRVELARRENSGLTAGCRTLFLAGVFGVAAGGANNGLALGSLLACLGFGVGGNLPVGKFGCSRVVLPHELFV